MSDKVSKVAFSHDSMSTDINPRLDKPGKLGRMFKTVPRTIATLAILACVVVLILHYRDRLFGANMAGPFRFGSNIRESNIRNVVASRTFIITRDSWVGVTNTDPDLEVVATIREQDVSWQWMIDLNPHEVIDMYPAELDPDRYVHLPPGRYHHWRIKPESNVRAATLDVELRQKVRRYL